MKLKRLVFMAVAIVLVFSLAACGGSSSSKTALKGTLTEILDSVYSAVPLDDVYPLMDREISADNYEFWTGLKEGQDKLVEGIVRQYEVTALTHATVLLKFDTPETATSLAKEMSQKMNLRKFGCLPAEIEIIGSSGEYVILIFDAVETSEYSRGAQAMYDAFASLAKNVGTPYEKR